MKIKHLKLCMILMVLTSVPLFSSSDTTMVFPIYPSPDVSFSGNTSVNENSTENYSVVSQIGAVYIWEITEGDASIKNQNNLSVNWGKAGNGKLKLVIVTSNGCTDSSEKPIVINAVNTTNPYITVSNYDFGKKPVDAVINRAGGHIGEVTVTNKTNQTIQLDSVLISDAIFKCSNQFPVSLGPKASFKLTVRFLPTEIKSYESSIQVFTHGTKSGATLKGEGTTIPNGTSITEIELSSDKLRVNPGEIVTIRMRLKSENPPIEVDPQEFTAYLEYDKSVLQWQQQYYVATMPGQMGQNTNILRVNTNRAKGNDYLIDIKFKALLGLSDSSKVIFSGKNAFSWTDTTIKAYQALIDSIVYINVCHADSIRLLKLSVPAMIETLSPNPVTESAYMKFSLLEDGQTSISIINTLGITKKVLFSGEKKSGNYELLFSTEDLESGMYSLVMKTASGLYQKRLVVVR